MDEMKDQMQKLLTWLGYSNTVRGVEIHIDIVRSALEQAFLAGVEDERGRTQRALPALLDLAMKPVASAPAKSFCDFEDCDQLPAPGSALCSAHCAAEARCQFDECEAASVEQTSYCAEHLAQHRENVRADQARADARLVWPRPDALADALVATRTALAGVFSDDAWMVFLNVGEAGWSLSAERNEATSNSATLPRGATRADLERLAAALLSMRTR